MSNGPLASTLVFLSSLPSVPVGSKVRFLGCVALSSGSLTLQHTYPPPPAVNATAIVDVTLLLEGLKREDIEVGAWVNVIGYVDEVMNDAERKRKRGQNKGGGGDESSNPFVKVKAVLLWNAGGVKLHDYERMLEDRIRVGMGKAP